MAKQKAVKEEALPVEQIIEEQPAPVVETEEAVETGETIVEETPVEVVEEVVEQPAPVVEAKSTPKASNEVGVVRIVQKTPSGFRILLETGEIIKVTKAQYSKGQSTIIL